MPDGPVMAKLPRLLRPRPGRAWAGIEGPRGLYGTYAISDGTDQPFRMKIHDPSFVHLQLVGLLMRGQPDRRHHGGDGIAGSDHGRGGQVSPPCGRRGVAERARSRTGCVAAFLAAPVRSQTRSPTRRRGRDDRVNRAFGNLTLAGKILLPLLFLVLVVGPIVTVLLGVFIGPWLLSILSANIDIVRFVVAVTAILLFSIPAAFIIIYMEMKVIALMNLRVGPDRVGPFGSLLSVVHGLKVLMKEDFTPTGADSLVFTWAPVIVFLTAVMTFLVIPFGPGLVGQDLNIGLLYLFAVGGMTVVGLLMAGWSSFNKYSLLGGLRSAAQVVSYEIPLTLSVVGLILLAGTMSLNQIARPAVRLVHRLVRVPPAAGRADLLHRRHRRGQPNPVRPDRGRLRDRGRVRHRVLGHAVRVPVLRRVRERVHHLGAHGDALLRGVERAVRLPGHPAGARPRRSWATGCRS